MGTPHIAPPPADFSPESCGRLMDFVQANDVSYAHLKAQAEKRVRQKRWSGAGKNMNVMGSYEPSRYYDTFAGNYRRAKVYRKIPARLLMKYEYWLDENGRLLAAIEYNTDPTFIAWLGPLYIETFFAGRDDDMTVYVCYRSGYQGKKELSYVLGYRYEGSALAEVVKLTYVGEAMTNIVCFLFLYDADGALVSADNYHMTGPALYNSPIAKDIDFPSGLSIPMISYRGVAYQILHNSMSVLPQPEASR